MGRIGKQRVQLRRQGLRPVYRKPFVTTTDSAHRLPVAPNLLDRRFDGWQPDQAWVADITYVATGEGWLRLCEQVHTGKLDLDQMNEAWGDYVPGFLDVIRKMASHAIQRLKLKHGKEYFVPSMSSRPALNPMRIDRSANAF